MLDDVEGEIIRAGKAPDGDAEQQGNLEVGCSTRIRPAAMTPPKTNRVPLA